MNNSNTLWKSLSVIILCLLLSSCFHLRQPSDFPNTLRTLYFTSNNVTSNISTPLKRQLIATGVTLTESPNAAPLTLTLYNGRNSVNMPVAFNNAAATNYTYQMLVHIRLTTNNHKVVIDTPIYASQKVIHNVNQIDSPVITPLMRSTLTRRIINSIFDVLTSIDTQKKLNQLSAHK